MRKELIAYWKQVIDGRYSYVLPVSLYLLLTIAIFIIQPMGPFYDLAHPGIETIEEVLQGNLSPYYPHYSGHQPLIDWLLAPLFVLIGISNTALHTVGIVAGAFTVLLLCLTGRILFSQRVGLYAGLIGTTSHWWLLLTNEGLRIVLVPPLMLLGIYSLGRIFHSSHFRWSIVWAIVYGVSIGGLGYVYGSAWILLPALAIAPLIFLFSRPKAKLSRISFFIAPFIVLLVLLPLLQYSQENPGRIFERSNTEIGVFSLDTFKQRIQEGIVPVTSSFFLLPTTYTTLWQEGMNFTLMGIPQSFPAPLLAPGLLLAMLIAFFSLLWQIYKRRAVTIPLLLFFLFFAGWIPSLITVGPQPHFRRIVVSFVPAFLLSAWGLKILEENLKKFRYIFPVIFLLSFAYGPYVYLARVLPSEWYYGNYYLGHNELARFVFARVDAGQKVAISGNTAHLKSLQFYALATPQNRSAFHLLPPPDSRDFKESSLQGFDTWLVVSNTCQTDQAVGFTREPVVIRDRSFVIGCIFDRPGISPELRSRRSNLPHTSSLLVSWWKQEGLFAYHTPFYGPIFGIEDSVK